MGKKKSRLSLLSELRGLAQEGLLYSKDRYDRERYTRILRLVASDYSVELGTSRDRLAKALKAEVGCITPKLGVEVAILNNDGKLLVLQRADDSTWGLPGGWVELGEEILAAAMREVKEETGIRIRPIGWIGITEKGPEKYPALTFHQVNVLVATQPVDNGVRVRISHEHRDHKWIDPRENIDWHPGHERLPNIILGFKRGRLKAMQSAT